MPSIEKALRRERKEKNRRKHGRDGDSVKLIQEIQQKRREKIMKKNRDKAIKKRRKRKESTQNG